MFESLRSNRKPKEESPFDPERRKFLKGTVATIMAGALGSLSTKAWAQETTEPETLPSVEERESLIDALVKSYESPETKRILESGTDAEIVALLKKWPEAMARADTIFYGGTKYDPRLPLGENGSPSFQIQANSLEDVMGGASETKLNNPDTDQIPYGVGSANALTIVSGDDTLVLTNDHVVSAMNIPTVPLRLPEEFDVAVARIPLAARGLSNPLHLVEQADLTGSLVFNYVVKNDDVSPWGARVRAGVALKVTPRIVEFMRTHAPGGSTGQTVGADAEQSRLQKSRMLASYMVVSTLVEEAPLPHWDIQAGEFMNQYVSFAQGSSGSAWVQPLGGQARSLAGIHWGGSILEHGIFGTESIGVSFFHGPDVLRKVIDIYRARTRE